MNRKPVRVLIADDHKIVRKGIIALLHEIDGIEVVGEAGDGREVVEKAAVLLPDVVLMDLVMPHVDGIEATREITQNFPSIRILALTSFAADDMVFPAIKAGALGYLLKDSDPQDLVWAIRQVHRGEPSLHPQIARKVLQELSQPTAHPPTPEPLTERELEVLQLVAQGMSNKKIADTLSIADVTVRTHVSNTLRKLHLANRVQAALYALREGLTSLDSAGHPPT